MIGMLPAREPPSLMSNFIYPYTHLSYPQTPDMWDFLTTVGDYLVLTHFILLNNVVAPFRPLSRSLCT